MFMPRGTKIPLRPPLSPCQSLIGVLFHLVNMFRFLAVLLRNSRSNFVRAMSSTSAEGIKNVYTNRDYYVWIDLEMTGLEENIHKIVEAACIITNDQLNVLHDGLQIIVHQPQEVFDEGNEWTKVNFAKSGLRQESLNSKISIEEADKMMAEYIKKVTNNTGKYYLAGNSVYMDKRFLEKYMKNVNELLHYRLIDVSSVKTLCSHWYPEVFHNLTAKESRHRALSDVKDSINELKLYRDKFFKATGANQ